MEREPIKLGSDIEKRMWIAAYEAALPYAIAMKLQNAATNAADFAILEFRAALKQRGVGDDQ